MIDERWVILGALINFAGGLSYVIATVRGEAKPNRVTWFIWALAPLIAFAAQVKQGVGIQSLLTFMVGFGPLMVFLASFVNKKAEWKLGHLDYICGGLSIIGLVLWQLTGVGNLAISFSILSDGLAGVPTIVKSYRFPETENHWAYTAAWISAFITLLTIEKWNFEHYGFPLYILAITSVFVLLIKFRLGKRLLQEDPKAK